MSQVTPTPPPAPSTTISVSPSWASWLVPAELLVLIALVAMGPLGTGPAPKPPVVTPVVTPVDPTPTPTPTPQPQPVPVVDPTPTPTGPTNSIRFVRAGIYRLTVTIGDPAATTASVYLTLPAAGTFPVTVTPGDTGMGEKPK